MTSHNRVARVERLEEWANDRRQCRLEEEKHAADTQRRWEETLSRFEALLAEDLLGRVDEALEDERCPLWKWLEDIVRGRSRLPECLTEAVMRRLVLIRLDEADKCDGLEAVCLRCGLQYPMHKRPPLSEWRLAPGCSPDERPLRYDLPHFFDHDGCPACGASSKAGEMNWAHLMEDGYWATDKENGSGGEDRQR
jgi:hypothetical protein